MQTLKSHAASLPYKQCAAWWEASAGEGAGHDDEWYPQLGTYKGWTTEGPTLTLVGLRVVSGCSVMCLHDRTTAWDRSDR